MTWCRLTFLLSIAILLAGCASTPNAYKGKDAGYLLVGMELDFKKGFIRARSEEFDSFTLYIRKKGDENTQEVRYSQLDAGFYELPKGYYESAGSRGSVYMVALPPGQYEIYDLGMSRTGVMDETYGSKEAFSIPFEIKTNELNYLGNYHAIKIMQKVWLGEGAIGAYVVLTDNQERDLNLVKVKYSYSSFNEIKSTVPDVDKLGLSFFKKERISKF